MVLVDKPIGLSSFTVVARARKQFNIKRVGHAGTLDPLASGLLIVLLGREETRLQDTFMHLPKVYEVTLELGKTSTTDDAEGELTIMRSPSFVTPELISECLKKFTGNITQVPPAFSAVHVAGQRAYKLARAGETVVLPSRQVTITNIEVLNITLPLVTLRVHCSHGTYIRSLARDIGNTLGCGAYVTQLRRTQIGSYSVDQATPLDDLANATVLPLAG